MTQPTGRDVPSPARLIASRRAPPPLCRRSVISRRRRLQPKPQRWRNSDRDGIHLLPRLFIASKFHSCRRGRPTIRRPSDIKSYLISTLSSIHHLIPCFMGFMPRSRYAVSSEERRIFGGAPIGRNACAPSPRLEISRN